VDHRGHLVSKGSTVDVARSHNVPTISHHSQQDRIYRTTLTAWVSCRARYGSIEMDARSSVPLLQITFDRCDCAILVIDLSP